MMKEVPDYLVIISKEMSQFHLIETVIESPLVTKSHITTWNQVTMLKKSHHSETLGTRQTIVNKTVPSV